MFNLISILKFMSIRKIGSPTATSFRRGWDAFGGGWFGADRDNGTRKHKGLDLVTIENEAIYAPISGTARIQNHNGFTGFTITSKTGRTFVKVLYLKDIAFKNGEQVTKGQIMGRAANIKPTYGQRITNHVHFEIKLDGVHLDPATQIISFQKP